MPFPNQGQNHINGIKNEKDIVNYMNENRENVINKHLEKENKSTIKQWEHAGGTKQKADALFKLENDESCGVSIKNHNSGTFDLENTTKNVPEDVKIKVLTFKNENKPKYKDNDNEISKEIREECENIFSSKLEELSSSDITNLLEQFYKKEENTKHIIVNDTKNKRLILLHKINLDKYCNSNHKHNFILKSIRRDAKTSRQIWIKTPEGEEINTNLRIRLHLNNGISALLGRSKSNPSSSPCLKIQQDNVDKFLEECNDKVIVNY